MRTYQENTRLIKLSILREFKKTLKQCQGHKDDRLLFQNSYNLLLQAVEEFYAHNFNNVLIRIAFNSKFDEEFQNLKLLEVSLKNRNMIS